MDQINPASVRSEQVVKGRARGSEGAILLSQWLCRGCSYQCGQDPSLGNNPGARELVGRIACQHVGHYEKENRRLDVV
jgi:hypothetical protein